MMDNTLNHYENCMLVSLLFCDGLFTVNRSEVDGECCFTLRYLFDRADILHT